MKTVQDYMNDPRILDDPDMAGALEPIREIHAIRLKLQDETAHMTPAEKIEFHNNSAKAFLARLGLPPVLVNLSGQGKLKPRVPVTH
jgi:hypothetical protein